MATPGSDRLQRIEDLYHAALECDPLTRKEYLAAACDGDDELFHEVESLLLRNVSNGPLSRPVMEAAAALLDAPLARGTRLGPYEILKLLGRGGMGAVYEARDTRLGRSVAIKVANHSFNGRFQREARAISSLNHPHICTLYDVGTNYLVMELIEGETLASVLVKGPRRLPVTLRRAAEIADALSAAHGSGVVHRDLKPGNVMLTRDGRIKVLDFGLAKLAGDRESATEGEAPTRTETGMIVGTPAYMSPEQAKGEPSDARSDIFSLGAVLYEMVTGRRPFGGNTRIETVAAVIHKDPMPANELVEGLPPTLIRLLGHCLQKDPALRLQDMGDVAILLRDATEEAGTSGEYAPERKSRWANGTQVGAAFLLLAAGMGASWFLRSPAKVERVPVLKRLTFDDGLTTTPAVSPDGKLLAYASDRAGAGNLNIWVRQLAGGEPIEITKDAADEYEPSFSPDGTKVVFRSDRHGGGIYVTSSLGNDEPRMLAPEGRAPRFSPDGTRIAYWVGDQEAVGADRPMRARLFVISPAGADRREVAPGLAAAYNPVWSPDGKYLAFAGSPIPHVGVLPDLYVVGVDGGHPVATGAAKVFASLGMANPAPCAWTDQNQIVLSALRADSTNVWGVQLKPGSWKAVEPAHRMTFGSGMESNAAMAKGSGAPFVFSALDRRTDLWQAGLNANEAKSKGQPQRIIRDESGGKQASITRDGRMVVFSSNRSGAFSVYARDLYTQKEILLTPGIWPTLSGDGKRMAYWSADYSKAFLLNLGAEDGVRAPMTLSLTPGFGRPYSLTGDGGRLFYAVKANERWGEDVLDIETGRSERVFRDPKREMLWSQPSPDGNWLAFTSLMEDRYRVQIAPLRAGEPISAESWVALTKSTSWEERPTWSPDGTVIYYFSDRDNYRCIWAQRLDRVTRKPTGPEIPVYHFHSARLSLRNLAFTQSQMAVASDKMVFNMAEITGSLWLAQFPEN